MVLKKTAKQGKKHFEILIGFFLKILNVFWLKRKDRHAVIVHQCSLWAVISSDGGKFLTLHLFFWVIFWKYVFNLEL